MLMKFSLGLNRVVPVHELIVDQSGMCECQKLQNYIVRDKKITKVGGTEALNSSAETDPISWLKRSYHKRADGTFTKVLWAYSGGGVYSCDLLNGTLTSRLTGLNSTAIPMDSSIQVSDNTILYLFTGEDTVYKYDGNGSYQWESTSINDDIGRIVESGVVHLDRMWYVSKNSSFAAASTTLKPEDFSTDPLDIVIGQETDSVLMRMVVGGNETLYAFKDTSIYQLYGRTTATFQFRKITDQYGLAAKRAVYPVGSGFIFLNEFDKELYFFGGTESSIRPLTEETIRLREILDENKVHLCDMTVHNGLFRFAFKHKDDSIYQDRELIYPVNDPRPDGLPKWSMIKGSKVYSYALMQQQNDDNVLMSGRSDTGKVMYHNRTNDFDGTAIETIVRTGSVVASENKRVKFNGFWIKGRPGSTQKTVDFRYFLDGRFSESWKHDLDTSGENRTVGSIKLSMQALFNNRIRPLTHYTRGNSISFELYDNNTSTDMELYSVAFDVVDRGKIRNMLVGR